MKKVRCPKCDNYIIFDETKYSKGQSLVFQCPNCGKQFGIKIGVSKLKGPQDHNLEKSEKSLGYLTVIENVFHYKQELPLHLGDNIIGRYMKGNDIDCAIETHDPSVDLHHCVINVSYDKHHQLKYVLRDGPSNTGTFVGNDILSDKERRVIENGTLFSIGATSIILNTEE